MIDFNQMIEQGTYSIDKPSRSLLIENKKLSIPDYFNFDNFLKNDTKTVDYIFTYFGYNYTEYKRI